MALMFAYGVWLRNGHDPDGFGELNGNDIQILISTEVGLRKMSARFIADDIARLFSGKDERYGRQQ